MRLQKLESVLENEKELEENEVRMRKMEIKRQKRIENNQKDYVEDINKTIEPIVFRPKSVEQHSFFD